MTAVVELGDLCKRFGGIVVADHVNVTLEAGRIVGLIGPNGAGKTSLFNLIAGVVTPDAGSIYLNGALVNRVSVHGPARLGVARTWQNIRLFPSLSVLDNLLIAPRLYAGESLARGVVGRRALREHRQALEERAFRQLEKVHMVAAAPRRPAELSYGKQKLVSLARALMNNGNCLLLDEPMAGVEGPAYEAIMAVVRAEAATGRAICVVEHNISFVKDLCEVAAFMFNGRIVASGTVETLTQNEELTALYFGREPGRGRRDDPA